MNEKLVRLLKNKNLKIAAAESCTGGAFMASIVKVPGASGVLPGGLVTYCDDAKVNQLGVNKEIIKIFGAVSREVAIEMAMEVRIKFGADVGVAVTGFAGPDGDRVGEVHFAISVKNEAFHTMRRFVGISRSEVIDTSVTFLTEWLCEKV